MELDHGRRTALEPAGPEDVEPRDDLTPFQAVNFEFDRAARRLGLGEDLQVSLKTPFRASSHSEPRTDSFVRTGDSGSSTIRRAVP